MSDLFDYMINITRQHASRCLDNMSQGLPDPQDAPVVRYCDGCEDEIYPGTAFQDIDTGKIYCEPWCAPADSETVAIEINSEGEIGA